MNIGIFTKPEEPRAAELVARIVAWGAEKNLRFFINERLLEKPDGTISASDVEIAEVADLIVTLGGDGTMLTVARLLAGRSTPVFGINLGTLGYLAEFPVEEALQALGGVIEGHYRVARRTLIDWSVIRQQEVVGAGSALNDVVVNKATLSRMIEIACTVGSHYVTTYRADGLIIATPTGSTAYNLSAGGPIIHPSVGAIVIAPICPHTLTNRPLILPDKKRIKLELKTREQEVILASDGQTIVQLLPDDVIEIKKSPNTFNAVLSKDKDYFQILRSKLRWSGR
ncbi:MAG: NAD(+)/NADH kinase [Acidobacteria bacterium]|nr:NAD(+)/NADH kinase [Acidobacteriota bacterium]